jgi:hypothetical protein
VLVALHAVAAVVGTAEELGVDLGPSVPPVFGAAFQWVEQVLATTYINETMGMID